MAGSGSHGGTRAGAGRPRLAGRERYKNGRALPLKVACGCGSLKNSRARTCRSCELSAKALPMGSCVMCGALFRLRYWHALTCGAECGKARTRQVNAAKRKSPDMLAARRRRAAVVRRQRCGRHSPAGRWRYIIERDGDACWLCHEPVDTAAKAPSALSPTVDHVLPLARGGSDADDNLRLAHFVCNMRRGVGRDEAAA